MQQGCASSCAICRAEESALPTSSPTHTEMIRPTRSSARRAGGPSGKTTSTTPAARQPPQKHSQAQHPANLPLPPASASSGRPPSLPPTFAAGKPTIFPACTRVVRSFVMPTIRETSPPPRHPAPRHPSPSCREANPPARASARSQCRPHAAPALSKSLSGIFCRRTAILRRSTACTGNNR
jgi:hypothetical protein